MSAEIQILHVPFRRELDKLRGIIAYTYHRPDAPTGGTLGDADFVIYGAGSRVLMIEFKDKETKISPTQKDRHAELAAVGIKVHIVREISIAMELLSSWRSTLGKVLSIDSPRQPIHTIGGKKFREVNNELVPL